MCSVHCQCLVPIILMHKNETVFKVMCKNQLFFRLWIASVMTTIQSKPVEISHCHADIEHLTQLCNSNSVKLPKV